MHGAIGNSPMEILPSPSSLPPLVSLPLRSASVIPISAVFCQLLLLQFPALSSRIIRLNTVVPPRPQQTSPPHHERWSPCLVQTNRGQDVALQEEACGASWTLWNGPWWEHCAFLGRTMKMKRMRQTKRNTRLTSQMRRTRRRRQTRRTQ